VAPPVLEEEEFPFLSPDERTCLAALQVSPALWQRVRQAEPATLQGALQHVITHREEILAAPPHSLECRLGGLLKGTYVPSSEPEIAVKEEEAPASCYLCRACGITYQGEHHCPSCPEEREPDREGDRWLQEMRERAERAQRQARE
jgi:Zn finger protein HypA/HybF involved in hydrogenase expression